MKIRNGWVANSSSSSFVVFTTKEIFETALAQLKDWEQDFVRRVAGKSRKLCGMELVSLGYSSDHSGISSLEDEELNIPDGEDVGEYYCQNEVIDKLVALYTDQISWNDSF